MPEHAADSRTPFIDRLAFMPPERPDIARFGISFTLSAIVGGIVTFAVLSINRGETGRRLVDAINSAMQGAGPVTIALALVLMYYAAVIVHELGHVAGGLFAGFRLIWIRVGPVLVMRDRRVLPYRGPARWLGGAVNMAPATPENLTSRAVLLVAGGPLANIVCGALLLFVIPPAGVWTAALLLYSLVLGVGSLVPMQAHAGTSDGARIGMLFFDPPRGERWVALLALQGEMDEGVLPESYSREFLARAVAVQDTSLDTVIAHLIAYSTALYDGKRDEAERCLETCVRFSSSCHQSVREFLISDVTVYVGSYRRQRALAEQWLAALPEKTLVPWVRLRAEAAVLEVAGDHDGALAKLERTEQLIRRDLPSAGSMRANALLMERWRGRIRAPELGVDDARHISPA